MTVKPLPPGEIPSMASSERGRQVLIAQPFTGGRAIKSRCGVNKNSYNTDTGDVLRAAPVAETFAELYAQPPVVEAFAELLSAGGIEISAPERPRA